MMEPTGPIKGNGVAAIDYNGDRYCVDCAPAVLDGESFSVQLNNEDWESYDSADGEDVVARLIDGDIYTLSSGGVVLQNSTESDIEHWHCGRHEDCVNAVSGEEYDHISHDEMVGVLLDIN